MRSRIAPARGRLDSTMTVRRVLPGVHSPSILSQRLPEMKRLHTDAAFESAECSRDNRHAQGPHREGFQTADPVQTSSAHHAARAESAVELYFLWGIGWMNETLTPVRTGSAIPCRRNATSLHHANTWDQAAEFCCRETQRGKQCPKNLQALRCCPARVDRKSRCLPNRDHAIQAGSRYLFWGRKGTATRRAARLEQGVCRPFPEAARKLRVRIRDETGSRPQAATQTR